MFEQSLVETSLETKRRKRWTAFTSYTLEVAAVLTLLIIPLIHTEALPLDDSPRIFPPTYHAPDNVQIIHAERQPASQRTQQAVINPLIPPTRIPTRIDRTPDPPQTSSNATEVCPGCIPVPGTIADNRPNLIMDSALHTAVAPPIRHAAPVPRTSTLQASLLLRQVKPIYPHLAIISRTQGAVVLHAIIARDGSIQRLELVSGPPLLTAAALQAVQQWKYRPYLLNNEPVEVETQITVNFTLGAN